MTPEAQAEPARLQFLLPSVLSHETDLLTLSRLLKSINLQFEVLEFFSRAKAAESAASIFGTDVERAALAQRLIVAGNMDLAFRLIQEFELAALSVYETAIAAFAAARQGASITALVRQVQALLSDEERDVLLRAAIEAQAVQLGDLKAAEQWVPLVAQPQVRVRGFIGAKILVMSSLKMILACLKLKLAFLEAAKLEDVALVQEVRDAALRFGMTREAELCDKWLAQHTPY